MEQLEDKINAILSNPEMMKSILSMAQSFGAAPSQESPQPKKEEGLPFDPAMLQKLSSLSAKGSISQQQRGLLQALSPYLSNRRLQKLEQAMRAAGVARFAISAVSGASSQSSSGR